MQNDAPPKAQREAQAVLDAIRRLLQVLREFSTRAEHEVGISGAQLFALQTLSRSGALTVNGLAARTLTHQASVSAVAKKLVASGLVARRPGEKDARCVELTVTAAGRAVLARSPAAIQNDLIAAIAALPDRDRSSLARTLGGLVERFAPSEVAPPMFFEPPTVRHPRRRVKTP